jgi:hypothetical protein
MPGVRWTKQDLEEYRRRTGLGILAAGGTPRQPEPVSAPALEREDRPAALLADPAGTIAVRLVRVGGRRMDSDNLAAGYKALRDAVAAAFGRSSDSEADGWRWEYAQEPGEVGTRIEIWKE